MGEGKAALDTFWETTKCYDKCSTVSKSTEKILADYLVHAWFPRIIA